jgi:hypothetical protein
MHDARSIGLPLVAALAVATVTLARGARYTRRVPGIARARLDKAGALLVASLLLALTAATDVHSSCNDTCKRDVSRCVATQCEGIGRGACRRRCKPAAIRTLAYVLNECQVDPAGLGVERQQLRIRRGDREPITVVEFGSSEPTPAGMLGQETVCQVYGELRVGAASVAVGALQRLAVSPDGSGVVFEVNQKFSILPPPTVLSPDQEGFFFVRSDGGGLRRLGPASRAVSFALPPDPTSPTGFSLALLSRLTFSPNGRRIAFEDLGPGPGGEAVQIVVVDLLTGQRTQVTHLPSGPPVDPRYPDSCCPQLIDNETVLFRTLLDLDGSNPEHDLTAITVRIDGSRFKPVARPVAPPGSRVVPTFGVAGLGTSLVDLSVPGTPVNPVPGNPINEVFVQEARNLIQLTNFRRIDTEAAFLSVTGRRAFFVASADPLGTNPYGNCQMFSVGTRGSGLRQVTHFNPGSAVGDTGCRAPLRPGCIIGEFRRQDPVTKAVVFDSACDPFDANPFGDQAFAMRPDGGGLRQLTDAAGFTQNPDGSIRVELPGPFAYSTVLH